MKRVVAMLLFGLALLLVGGASDEPTDSSATQTIQSLPRFVAVNVYVDPKGKALAAYQFELTCRGGGAKLVGVEGGEHAAFAEPPYYDPKANVQNRIIIAAFNAGENLPRRRTRVATVMVEVTGLVRWSAALDVAAASDAQHIDASISVSEGAMQ